jgi:hypothetical protein
MSVGVPKNLREFDKIFCSGTAKRRPACAKRFGEGRECRWRLFSTFPKFIQEYFVNLAEQLTMILRSRNI